MRSRFSKILFTLSVMVLIIEPILQIVFNLGVSYAAEVERKIIYVPEGSSLSYYIQGDYSILSQWKEYQYKVHFNSGRITTGLMSVAEAKRKYQEDRTVTAYKDGASIGVIRMKNVQNSSDVWSCKVSYTLVGTMEFNNWVTKIPTSYSISASHDGISTTINGAVSQTNCRTAYEVAVVKDTSTKDSAKKPVKDKEKEDANKTGTSQPSQPSQPTYTPPQTTTNINSQYGNKQLNITDDSKRLYIRALYRRVLGREPDNAGMDNWMKQSVQNLSYGIIFSKESKDRNGIDNMSNDQLIKAVYDYIFGRNGNTRDDEVAYWRNLMNQGLTREKLVKANAESAEFIGQRIERGETITIELNEKLCDAVQQSMINETKDEVYRLSSTKLLMYSYEPAGIKLLNLSGKGITDISGIDKFPNLEELNLNDNQVQNVSEVSKLSKLKILCLNNNQLGVGVDFVSNLTNLEKLYLDNNNLGNKDLEGKLNNLTKLVTLSITDNRITSIDGIVNNLPSLGRLFIRNNSIGNINILNSKTLSAFEAYNNTIASATAEEKVTLPQIFTDAMNSSSKVYSSEGFEYTNCKLENQKLVHIDNDKEATIKIKSGAAKGTTFKHTNSKKELAFNDEVLRDRIYNIVKADVISTEAKNGKYYITINKDAVSAQANFDLSATKIDARKITDVTGIEQFPNLKVLNLNNNNVKNLHAVSQLKKLETISLRYNELRDLDAIAGATNLKQIDASGNYITKISGVSGLKSLQDLILEDNLINNNLQALSVLTNLKTLNINNNGTTDISALRNLKLTGLAISKNGIADISMINRDNLSWLLLKDNVVTINFTDKDETLEIPSILQEAIKKNGIECLEMKYGTVANNKINLWYTKCNDQIVVKSGELKGTIVNLENPKWTTPPEVTVEKEYSSDKSSVTVRLKTNGTLAPATMWPFQRVGDSENPYIYEATFGYNIENWVFLLKGIGGTTELVLNVDGVQNKYVPGLKLSYSEASKTKNDVTVTISTTGNDKLLAVSGFQLSADGKSMTKVVTGSNVKHDAETYGVKYATGGFDVKLEKDRDLSIDNWLKYSVKNIDIDAPDCKVEYQADQSTTATSMIVKLWAKEEFDVYGSSGKVISKEVKNGALNPTYEVLLYYTKNVTENITVKDALGNRLTTEISITNIDNGVDGYELKSNESKYTNKNIVLKAYANENISILGNTMAAVKPVVYSARTVLLANNGENIATPYEEDINISKSESGVITVKDDNDNIDMTVYNTSFIDKEAPVITNKKEVENEDGSITVIVTFNEPIQYTDNENGWKISEDGEALTKTFRSDAKEKITVTDLAGNQSVQEIEVYDVSTISYVYSVEEIEGTDKCLAVISADREIQEVFGWTMLEDGKSMCKVILAKDYQEELYIRDNEGNSSKVYVTGYEFTKAKEDGDTSKPSENEEEDKKPEKGDEDKKPENTEMKEELPKGGESVLLVSIILVLVAYAISRYVLGKLYKF